ncbi:MAG TPA: acetyl-coenzyme A synthetase N-terminal domain-containing protein, partial [Candidatus Dormibacteraeota bacterium]
MSVDARTIEALLQERRSYPPPDGFAAQANVKDDGIYAEAAADRLGFWARMARENVSWFKDFDTTLEWDLPFAKWFI